MSNMSHKHAVPLQFGRSVWPLPYLSETLIHTLNLNCSDLKHIREFNSKVHSHIFPRSIRIKPLRLRNRIQAQSAQTDLVCSQSIPFLYFSDIQASELNVPVGTFLECCSNILSVFTVQNHFRMFPECSETAPNGMFTFLAPKYVHVSVEMAPLWRQNGAFHSNSHLFSFRGECEKRKKEKRTSDDSCVA